ncbi:MAG: hypothetical protein L0Z73_15965 [Gammaproteobacteria bacterium]|nr:hypothetical protein [Gammaproteobacteria bacterium]
MYTVLVWVVMLLFALTGCEILIPQEPKVEEEAVLEKYKDADLRELLNKVQVDFAKAKDESLYFYSPNNYQTARTGIQTARAYFNDPERKTQVLKSIYKTEMALNDAFEVKKIVDREMSEIIALRINLDDLEAKKFHGSEYQGLATTTAGLVEQIEVKKEALFQDPVSKSRFEEQKNELIASMKDFRVRVVKHKYLNQGENLLAEADRHEAKKFAPVTYGAALKNRDDAVAYIEQNIDNLAGIQQQSEQFEFAAQRLMHIAREISNLIALKEDTYEQYILREEERLIKISKALKTADLRNQNFSTQATQLAASARQTVSQKENNALKIAELSSGNTAAESIAQGGADGDGPQPVVQQPQQAQPAVAPDPLVAGVAGGDLETLKNSVRVLTDQLYQLTLENSELKGQRDQLKSQLGKLEAQLSHKSSPPQKSKTAPDKTAQQKSGETQAGQQTSSQSVKEPPAKAQVQESAQAQTNEQPKELAKEQSKEQPKEQSKTPADASAQPSGGETGNNKTSEPAGEAMEKGKDAGNDTAQTKSN